jgi:hypothetical protein
LSKADHHCSSPIADLQDRKTARVIKQLMRRGAKALGAFGRPSAIACAAIPLGVRAHAAPQTDHERIPPRRLSAERSAGNRNRQRQLWDFRIGILNPAAHVSSDRFRHPKRGVG